MKVIFFSPLTSLWSEDLNKLSSLINAEVVSVGELVKSEIKKQSELGISINALMQKGDVIYPDIVSELISKRFFNDSTSKILVNYPVNNLQAKSLVKFINKAGHQLDAVVTIDIGKEATKSKLLVQYHRDNNPPYPKADPIEEQLSSLVESYYHENTGKLASALILSEGLGVNYVVFTTPDDTKERLLKGIRIS